MEKRGTRICRTACKVPRPVACGIHFGVTANGEAVREQLVRLWQLYIVLSHWLWMPVFLTRGVQLVSVGPREKLLPRRGLVFSNNEVGRRLADFREHERGTGFWISPSLKAALWRVGWVPRALQELGCPSGILPLCSLCAPCLAIHLRLDGDF